MLGLTGFRPVGLSIRVPSNVVHNYRADIDGLRAVAILGVLVYHLDPAWLSGGFVGVDVFFVISGYLIAAIIYRDAAGKGFSLLKFYEKRIRRIIPALFVMFLAVGLYAVKVLPPGELMDLAKSMRYAVYSISNFFFLSESEGYFTEGVAEMPLLHTWSLAVEEQFYIFFPFVIVAGHRWLKTKHQLVAVIGVLGLISLGLSQWMVLRNAAQAFYALPWRAWEMLIGSFLALAPMPGISKVRENALGVVGLGLIGWSMVVFDHATVFPGLSALMPCVGAALVIFSGRHPGSWVARFLSLKPLVGIGLISYSVYLWHWPLIVFAKYSYDFTPSVGVALFLVSLVLGFLSWRFVEIPFRNPGFLGRRKIFAGWAMASVVFIAATMVIKRGKGFPDHYPQQVQDYWKDNKWPERYRSTADETFDPALGKIYGNESAVPSVAAWGDSHLQSLLPMLDQLALEKGVAIRSYGMNGQPPITGIALAGLKDAKQRAEYSTRVLEILKADPNIKTVIMQARWNIYFKGNNEHPDEKSPLLYGHTFDRDEDREKFIAAKLKETVDALVAAGKKVVLVYPTPEIGFNLPKYATRRVLSGREVPQDLPLPHYEERGRTVVEMLDAYRSMDGVVTIPLAGRLMHGDRIKLSDDQGKLIYWDSNHLSVSGALYLRDLFEGVF